MKKIVLSISLALGCLALSIGANAQVQRTVLIEEFTQASCGPCASQNPAFNALLSANTSKVVQIKYQTSWPGSDPMNAQNPTDVATRVSKYNVTGVPFAVIDGDTNKNPATAQAYAGAPFNINQTMIDNEYALTTPIAMTATYSYNAVTDSFTSVVTVTNMSSSPVNASAANQLKLMFALVEMNINFATAPGTNGETAFYYVMRKLEPSATGNQLPDVLAPSTPYTFTIKDKAPSYIYQKAQMAAVAFVQDLGNNKVYQARLATPPNTVDIKAEYLGTTSSTNYCGATITPSVKITNLTATAITSATVSYTLNGTASGTPFPWTGNLANGQSATINLPAITAPNGTNIYKFSVTNINGTAVDINEANNNMNSILTNVVGNAPSPFYETFESSAVGAYFTSQSINNNPIGSYVVDKTVLSTLTQKLGAYGLSDKSYRYRFYNVAAGNRMGLVFYKNNLSSSTFSNVTFDYAYNDYSGTDGTAEDTLAVKVSTDCGVTWTEIWKKAGADLKTTTAAGISAAYYPAITEWKEGIANLPSPFNKASELLIMFEGQSGFGNNLYLDNIRFWYPLGVENTIDDNSITIYPNPVKSDINVNGINGNVTIDLIDLSGRIVKTISFANVTNDVKFNVEGLAKGSYFLKINQENKATTKSISIVE